MATLGELKARIRLETNKDDIASGGEAEAALTTAIAQAIEYYSTEQFWFNRASGAANTSASIAAIALPAGVRYPHAVSYLSGLLTAADLSAIEYRTEAGLPSSWAENEGAIQLWPIPDATYALGVYGLASAGIPASDGTSNIWTTEALDLICARAKFMLYRDVWRDMEAVQLSASAEGEALSRLRKETRRRGASSLRSTGDEPWTARSAFRINRE
ncbi:MAG: hypothetical protein JWN69_2523 [Alphaproteobacteria bacterium]|nr:hypothetical protein [Alphaproteobacteria bacterium]